MRKVVVLAILLLLTLSVSAQGIISRSALDSLVRPQLSTIAKGALSLDQRVKDVGVIEDSSPTRASYTLHNELKEPITITNIKTSCGCLKVCSERVTTIGIDESYKLIVEFDPSGRSGSFSYDISIYTSLDTTQPTERLTLNGEIRRTDIFSHLTEHMGALRLSRKSVRLDGVSCKATRREYIAIANGGARALRPTARATEQGLRLRCEPEVLEPGAEGELIIEYRPTSEPQRDIETILIVEGVEASPSERMIRITLKR